MTNWPCDEVTGKLELYDMLHRLHICLVKYFWTDSILTISFFK